MSASLKGRLLRGGSWVLAGKVVTAASNVLISSLLARLLTEQTFGAYGLAFSLVTAGALFSQLGLQQAVVRLVAESMGVGRPGRARAAVVFAYRHVIIGILVVVAFVLLGGGRWLALGVWESPALAGALGAVAAWTAMSSLQVLTSETFRGFTDLRMASVFGGVITGVLTLAALAVVAAATGSVSLDLAIWISAVSAALSLALGLTLLRRRLNRLPRTDPLGAREVIPISGPLWISAVTTFVLSQSALWIIGAYLPKEEVGLYFAALRLVTLVSMPLILINLVVPPFIAELYSRGEKQRLERVIRTAATFAGLPAFAVLVSFLVFGGPIMALVYGSHYAAGAPLLALLSIGYLVNVWTGSCGVTLNMTGFQTVLMCITIVCCVISLGGALLVVGRYGVLGVASVVCATAVIQNLAMWVAARHYAGIWTHAAIPTRRDIRSLLSRPAEPPSPEV